MSAFLNSAVKSHYSLFRRICLDITESDNLNILQLEIPREIRPASAFATVGEMAHHSHTTAESSAPIDLGDGNNEMDVTRPKTSAFVTGQNCEQRAAVEVNLTTSCEGASLRSSTQSFLTPPPYQRYDDEHNDLLQCEASGERRCRARHLVMGI